MIPLITVVQGLKSTARVGPVGCSVDSVRARLGNLIEDRATGAAEFGREVGSLNADLLNGVRIGDGKGRSGHRDVVILDAVNHEVVAARPLAVDGIGKSAILVN